MVLIEKINMPGAFPAAGNIVLIGMSGTGKTAVGKWISENAGIPVVDTDELLFGKYGWEEMRNASDELFLERENELIGGLALEKTVITTGGSVIYGKEAMERLNNISIIVYLDTPCEEIEKRVGKKPTNRFIIYRGKNSIRELFGEREPLYRKYAHIIVNTYGAGVDEIGKAIMREYEAMHGALGNDPNDASMMAEGGKRFYSTNDHSLRVDFRHALLGAQPGDYGLYMIPRKEIPKISPEKIKEMGGLEYPEVAFEVLNPYLSGEISEEELRSVLEKAYAKEKIHPRLEHVGKGKTHILWLDEGPTYAFKDYAARFYGQMLSHFLREDGSRRIVLTATSGDTGGAIADALAGLDNVDAVIFYPKDLVTPGQKRQMTTPKGNIYAFEMEGNFDVCQALVKRLLGDMKFALEMNGDPGIFTSANSISLGRLLPQTVYPFFAYSRIVQNEEKMVASIPCGNLGNMMGTLVAKAMGLPVSKILCGVNENTEFHEFLMRGTYTVKPAKKSPSSAMIISHPSNLARLVDFYGGHMYDRRKENGELITPGVIEQQPAMDEMRRDIFSNAVTNEQHYETMREAYGKYGIVLDPHGAVAWRTLDRYAEMNDYNGFALVYETADPGKFPEEVEKALGFSPPIPKGITEQEGREERIYHLKSAPVSTPGGLKLSDAQLNEAKEKLKGLFSE